jgi:hypothetical protein
MYVWWHSPFLPLSLFIMRDRRDTLTRHVPFGLAQRLESLVVKLRDKLIDECALRELEWDLHHQEMMELEVKYMDLYVCLFGSHFHNAIQSVHS